LFSVNKKRQSYIDAPVSDSPLPFIPGLVSVTFRRLQVESIVELATEARLRSIEWGGDIHVPHGDVSKAAQVRKLCEDAGIAISAYGSYYRAWASEKSGVDFSSILDTAQALATSTIRVWAGNLASAAAPPGFQEAVVADLKRICQLAAPRNCSISLEFHGGTLTDNAATTRALIDSVALPNLTSYWQPPVGIPTAQCLAGLKSVLPYLQNLHVFHWWPDQQHRLSLSEGQDQWRQYLSASADVAKPRHASLEFVRDDDPEQFRRDAKTLLNLLNKGL
jgi:3-dehydroshikimate dehydratase